MDQKKAAVIVETRSFTDLAQIITQHMQKLPPDWELFIFHSDENKHLLEDLNANKINIGPIDINGYNHLLTSIAFWDYMPHDKILIFQHDSMLLRKGISDFLMWDYIGAPIPGSDHQNGGFSLRTKQVMIDVIKRHAYRGPFEDTYFSENVPSVGKKAPKDVAAKFSCEMTFTAGTLGYHAIHRYMNSAQISFIKHQYNPSLFQGLK